MADPIPNQLGFSTSSDSEVTRQVEAVVFALIPEFGQVLVRDAAGHRYALTSRTRGVDLAALENGQRLLCKVTHLLPRVLSAEAIP